MNKERTEKYVRVMQAYLDGKVIQYKSVTDPSDGWDDNETPRWQWHLFDYRIKPEPKIIYVNEYNGEMHDVVHQTPERAKRGQDCYGEDSLPPERIAVPYVRLSDVELLK